MFTALNGGMNRCWPGPWLLGVTQFRDGGVTRIRHARFPHLLAIGIVVLSVGLLVLALCSAGFAAALRSRGVRGSAP